jgi:hypothetical protein
VISSSMRSSSSFWAGARQACGWGHVSHIHNPVRALRHRCIRVALDARARVGKCLHAAGGGRLDGSLYDPCHSDEGRRRRVRRRAIASSSAQRLFAHAGMSRIHPTRRFAPAAADTGLRPLPAVRMPTGEGVKSTLSGNTLCRPGRLCLAASCLSAPGRGTERSGHGCGGRQPAPSNRAIPGPDVRDRVAPPAWRPSQS